MSGSENIAPDAEVAESAAPVSEDPFQAAEAEAFAAHTAESEEVVEDPAPPADEPVEDEQDPEPEGDAPEEEAEADATDEDGGTDEEPDFSDDPRYEEWLKQRKAETDKHFDKQSREIAAMKREYDARLAELRAQEVEDKANPQSAPEVDGPPAEPAQDAPKAEWDSYYDERSRWIARQEVSNEVAEMRKELDGYKSGMNYAQQQAQAQRFDSYVQAKDGFSPEVGEKMMEIAAQDTTGNLASQAMTNQYVTDLLFEQARTLVAHEQEKQAAAASEKATIQRQKGAGKRAVTRNAPSPKATPIDPFSRAGLKGLTAEQKMDIAEKHALDDYRS